MRKQNKRQFQLLSMLKTNLRNQSKSQNLRSKSKSQNLRSQRKSQNPRNRRRPKQNPKNQLKKIKNQKNHLKKLNQWFSNLMLSLRQSHNHQVRLKAQMDKSVSARDLDNHMLH